MRIDDSSYWSRRLWLYRCSQSIIYESDAMIGKAKVATKYKGIAKKLNYKANVLLLLLLLPQYRILLHLMLSIFFYIIFEVFDQHGCMLSADHMRHEDIVSSLLIEQCCIIDTMSTQDNDCMIVRMFYFLKNKRIRIIVMDGRDDHLHLYQSQFIEKFAITGITIQTW